MKFFITGGCGFLGTNIATRILNQEDHLVIFDNLSRIGASENLKWLKTKAPFNFIKGDIRDRNQIEAAIASHKPDVIFHLAGQVAMTTSISNPQLDFETNAQGTLHLLESVRIHSPESIIFYSSTNKVYGDLEGITYEEGPTRYNAIDYPYGFSEKTDLNFHSPYGCSKGAADQYMLDYHRVFKLRTIVFRHSSMFGGRQFSTFDQGWIGWFCQQAIHIEHGTLQEPFTISGNGKQVRDVLYADDMVELYLGSVQHVDRLQGQAFNIGGGMQNSLSLLELFQYLENQLNLTMEFTRLPPRESDQKVFVADIRKITQITNWLPKTDKYTGINKVLEWLKYHDRD